MILRFELLGGFRVLMDGKPAPRLRSERPQALLAFLAAHPDRHHSREVLMEMLWPDAELDAARNRLNVSLNRIREHLSELGEEAREALCSDRSCVWLEPSRVESDLAQFLECIERASRSSSQHEQVELLQTAIALYRGSLLPGFYDDWVSVEQERLRERFNRAATDLIQGLESQGRLDDAIEASRHVCSVDPLLEEAHRDLIRLLARAGRKAEALQQYRLLEQILREQLDSEPSEETRELARELRDGDHSGSGTDGTARQFLTEAPSTGLGAHVIATTAPSKSPVERRFTRRLTPLQWIGASAAVVALIAIMALTPRTEKSIARASQAAPPKEGVRLWMASYEPEPDEKDSEPKALGSDTAGNLYVGAVVQTLRNDSDILTLKYSPDGVLLWKRRYNNRIANDCDRPTHVSVDGIGNVVVLGESYTGDRGKGGREWDLVALKYSSNGLLQWARRIDDGRRQDDRPAGMGVDSAGNIYLAGTSTADNRAARFLVEKTDPKGNLLWRDLFTPEHLPMRAENWAAGSFHVDENGSSVLTGAGLVSVGANRTSEDLLTLRYDRHGSRLWQRRYSSDRAGSTVGRVVAVDDDQNIYVAGTFHPFGTWQRSAAGFINEEVVVVKYDRHGDEVWSTHCTPGREQVHVQSLTVDSQGRSYVVTVNRGNAPASQTSGFWGLGADGQIRWDRSGHFFGVQAERARNGGGVVVVSLRTEWDSRNTPIGTGVSTALHDPDGNILWKRTEFAENPDVRGGILHQNCLGQIISAAQEPIKGKHGIRLYAYAP